MMSLQLRRISWQAARRGLLLWLALAAAQADAQGDFQGATHMMPFDEEGIGYGKATATGAVARLQARIDKGEVKLALDRQSGYLLSLLDALKVPRSSQMLVFSKTSFQRERISPRRPRALFFNDDVYIGFIPGSPLLEISVADPKLGAVFYTLYQDTNAKPRFVRNDQCLECHASAKSMGVPGHLVRSFATDEDGVVDLSSGTSLVNHRTPLSERWGGWYVTGASGGQTHRGNLFGKAAFAKHEQEPNADDDLEDLKGFFDASRYPGPHSDLVALMVLEHQTHLHNFITRLQYEATMALQTYGHLNYLKNISEAFLKYLLFTEEAPLTAAIRGTSGFVKDFATLGPRDRQGRSLRDFDLQTRLFKHPCSYLIYSEAFEALPEKMKAHLYQRLWDILSGKDTNPDFEKLTSDDRRAILEILCDTRPGLPDYWKTATREKRGVQESQSK
jgi:hypothetical protein